MTFNVLLFSILSLVFLLLYAIVRLSESAFVHLSADYVDSLENPKPGDYLLEHWLDKPSAILVSYSLMKYIFLVCFVLVFIPVIVSCPFVDELYKVFLFGIPSIFLLLWIFGELFIGLFSRHLSAKMVKMCYFFLIPTSKIVTSFRSLLLVSYSRHEKRFPRKETISISDISDVIENTSDEPEEINEKRLIKGVINFSDLDVKEIMRNRIDVVAVSINATFSEILTIVVESGYSRFPVYDKSLDDIKGMLYIKDVIGLVNKGESDKWCEMLRPVFYVPENLKITQLLSDFQAKKTHMAIIVDEYGGTSGIVTLEDILEEIVGDICDESDIDSDETLARKISETEFIFDGKISLVDFSKFTGLNSDIFNEFENEAESVAGVILIVNGNFPERSQHIMYKNIEFVVLSMDKRRIKNVKVIIHEKPLD